MRYFEVDLMSRIEKRQKIEENIVNADDELENILSLTRKVLKKR